MKRVLIAGGAIVAVLVLLAVAVIIGRRVLAPGAGAPAAPSAAAPPPAVALPTAEEQAAAAAAHPGFLYGRVITDGGATFEGRLRFGGGEEAFWNQYFNGYKDENPWAAHVPPERLKERRPIEILGIDLAVREHEIDLGRPFMARFGDVARIEKDGRRLRVTLKSGTTFDLDRFGADDFADGVLVWDGERGEVELEERRIQAIELLPTARLGDAPDRLQGTVRTSQGVFTGFVQWDREECVGSDLLDGYTGDRELSVRFDTIRSIARHSSDSSLVTLLDGREIELAGTNDVDEHNRGLFVDDPRYGRVLVSWQAFERVDFGPGDSGPAYGDFPPGHPLTGRVTTRDGRRLTGRLVYDLDETETTETLDAPSRYLDFTIPFGLIASIALPGGGESGAPRAVVTLHGGEELEIDRSGDLAPGNLGMLIFPDVREHPEYVPWTDVARIDLDRPPAMYPPLEGGPAGPPPAPPL
jgi:hypothetical protein